MQFPAPATMTGWHIKPTDSCRRLTKDMFLAQFIDPTAIQRHLSYFLEIALAKVTHDLAESMQWTYFGSYFTWHLSCPLFLFLSFDTLSLTGLWLPSLYFQFQQLPKNLCLGGPEASPIQYGLTILEYFSALFPYKPLLEFPTFLGDWYYPHVPLWDENGCKRGERSLGQAWAGKRRGQGRHLSQGCVHS